MDAQEATIAEYRECLQDFYAKYAKDADDIYKTLAERFRSDGHPEWWPKFSTIYVGLCEWKYIDRLSPQSLPQLMSDGSVASVSWPEICGFGVAKHRAREIQDAIAWCASHLHLLKKSHAQQVQNFLALLTINVPSFEAIHQVHEARQGVASPVLAFKNNAPTPIEACDASDSGNPGRPNSTKTVADFANKLRPKTTWMGISVKYRQEKDASFPVGAKGEQLVRDAWRRHYGDKKRAK